MHIQIFQPSSRKFRFKRPELQTCLISLARDHGTNLGWIHFIIQDSNEHTELNFKYLSHSEPTDVLTFSFDEEVNGHPLVNGEVYINHEVAEHNAAAYGCSLKEELYRLMIHGALHLCGMDDDTPEKRANMHEEENKYLQRFM